MSEKYEVTFNVYSANADNNQSQTTDNATWTTTTTSGTWTTGGWSTGGTITIDPTYTGDTWTTVSIPSIWPADPWEGIEHPVGIIYVEDNKLKLKDRDGNETEIADLDDEDISAKLIAVIAKKKLDEAVAESEKAASV